MGYLLFFHAYRYSASFSYLNVLFVRTNYTFHFFATPVYFYLLCRYNCVRKLTRLHDSYAISCCSVPPAFSLLHSITNSLSLFRYNRLFIPKVRACRGIVVCFAYGMKKWTIFFLIFRVVPGEINFPYSRCASTTFTLFCFNLLHSYSPTFTI